MEIHIIVGLSLTLIILLFAIWMERKDMRVLQAKTSQRVDSQVKALQAEISRLEAETSQRVDSQVKALQAEISRLEGVRRALAKGNQLDGKISVSYRKSPPELFQSNLYWRELSEWLREEKQWTCERCNICLKDRKYYLHVHHIFGRGFNSPQHLKVLCIGCHAEEPDHAFMKAYPEYKAFLEWKKGRRRRHV